MQAAVYRGVNDVRIETVPVPEIEPGEVLIRVHSCGICGTDLKKIHTGSHSAPRIFGHETVGTIAALGDGVEGFSRRRPRSRLPPHPLRRMLLLPQEDLRPMSRSTNRSAAPRALSPPAEASPATSVSWTGSSERGLIKIPDGIPFDQAVFVEPLNTCLKGIRSLNLAADETVLVIGQGPIGIMLASLARRSGARYSPRISIPSATRWPPPSA